MFRHLVYFLLFAAFPVLAQELPFSISLKPVEIQGLGGLQSFAVGQHDGKWLIVGGRLDGLHRRQPFASFDLAGHNNQLIVVDVMQKKSWSKGLTDLPQSIREQLSSTNMEFIQGGNVLYCLGGYGYSETLQDHTTFDKITAIQVNKVIEAITAGKDIKPYFRQYQDAKMQVTGGHLHKINDTYYLLGGQKFLGRYNPMGPDHGPGFVQEYTNAIRKFKLTDDGQTLVITHLNSYTDVQNLHRRDYNAREQIMPDGSEGITMFSGVFRVDADLPFLNAVNVDSMGYSVNDSFQQLFNHYHCATLPVYDAEKSAMHTLFFGGIAQYYMENEKLVKDDNVPFVKTIAAVSRDAKGIMSERVLPTSMPSLLGAGSEFIISESVPTYKNGVIKFDQLDADSTMVGHIFGGISSTAPNIFFTNDGSQSEASNHLFEVWLVKNKAVSNENDRINNSHPFSINIFPNPGSGNYTLEFYAENAAKVSIQLLSIDGKVIKETKGIDANRGLNSLEYWVPGDLPEGNYIVRIAKGKETASAKLVLKR